MHLTFVISLTKTVQEANKKPHFFPVLELEENQVGDEGAEAIAVLIEKNKTVSEIRLTENFVSDSGAESFARVLGQKHLFVLSLASNQITTKGATALASAVQSLDRQLVIDLSFNKLVGRSGFSEFFSSSRPLEMELFKMVLNPTGDVEESKTK
jgi:Ran GTPase-activating protein (RanGAP) involved in mRNA processing and transport